MGNINGADSSKISTELESTQKKQHTISYVRRVPPKCDSKIKLILLKNIQKNVLEEKVEFY